MKRILTLLIIISATQIAFSQPPRPGSDPSNSTSRNRPSRSVNATKETPLATGTALLACLICVYLVFKRRKKGEK